MLSHTFVSKEAAKRFQNRLRKGRRPSRLVRNAKGWQVLWVPACDL